MIMKSSIKSLLILLSAISLSSCSTMYQVLVTSSTEAKQENQNYVFENNDMKISYNFWTQGGQISFVLTNKTDAPIYIDWNKSHFIYNGVSYEYWFDSEEAKAFYTTTSISTASSFADAVVNVMGNNLFAKGNGSSVTSKQKLTLAASSRYKPKQIIQIPPKSSILVSKFSISKSPYYSCEFPLKFTNYKTPSSSSFTNENTPLKFRNYLTYSSNESFDQPEIIDNNFYISQILNMSYNSFVGKPVKERYCKKSGYYGTKYTNQFPYKMPNSFYIEF